MILDALIGLGIIGGVVLILILFAGMKYSYMLIYYNNKHYWIGLLLIQQIVLNMVSGAIYFNQLLAVLLTFIFIKFGHARKKINNISLN